MLDIQIQWDLDLLDGALHTLSSKYNSLLWYAKIIQYRTPNNPMMPTIIIRINWKICIVSPLAFTRDTVTLASLDCWFWKASINQIIHNASVVYS